MWGWRKKEHDVLGQVRVTQPCPTSWETMKGDDTVRYCSLCRLHVYNLSGMDREAAIELLERAEGRLCVRYLQRADGTILTQDCPVGLQKARKRFAQAASGAAAFCASVLALRPTFSHVVVGQNAYVEHNAEMVGDMPVPYKASEPTEETASTGSRRVVGKVSLPSVEDEMSQQAIKPIQATRLGGIAPIHRDARKVTQKPIEQHSRNTDD